MALNSVANSSITIGGGGGSNVTTLTANTVGIGTSNPAHPLHVIGDARIQGNLTVNGTQTIIDTNVATTERLDITNNGTGPALRVTQLGAQPIADFYDDSNVLALRIADGGNVGIGTSNPANRLTVSGNASMGVAYSNVVGPSNGLIVQGNVGIGMSNPRYPLHANGDVMVSDGNLAFNIDPDPNYVIKVRGTGGVPGGASLLVGNYLELGNTHYNNVGFISWNCYYDRTNAANTNQTDIMFKPHYAAGTGLIMQQDGGGVGSVTFKSVNWGGSANAKSFSTFSNVMQIGQNNVGIGISNPSQRLHVDGNLYVSNGNVRVSGKVEVVHRRPLFGVNNMVRTSAISGSTPTDIITNNLIYGPYSYAIPTVQNGATRYYRLYVVYSDNITNGVQPVIRIVSNTNANSYVDYYIDATYGDILGNHSRDCYSGMSTSSFGGHGYLRTYIPSNATGNGGAASIYFYYIELQTLDVF